MVIQRWQSVLLLIAAVMMGIFSFLSLGQVQLEDYSLNFTTMGFYVEGESTGGTPAGFPLHTWPFFAVSLLSAILPFINIFLYRNLAKQKLLCLVEVLFILTTVGAGCVYGYQTFADQGAVVSWSSLIVAPLLAFLADLLAYYRIVSDDRKIKAADRLR